MNFLVIALDKNRCFALKMTNLTPKLRPLKIACLYTSLTWNDRKFMSINQVTTNINRIVGPFNRFFLFN